jgi:hypothetical protein
VRPIEIARACHEANRALCLSLGDRSQPHWEHAQVWQRSSAEEGVQFALMHPGLSPRQSHDNWMAHKKREGWTYGPEKDAKLKTHPCMREWDELPEEQRRKDALFLAVVRALSEPV